MSTLLIAFVLGGGASAFVWSKLNRRLGNTDPTTLYLASGGAGLLAFVVALVALKVLLGF